MLGIFPLPWTPPAFFSLFARMGGSSPVSQAGWDPSLPIPSRMGVGEAGPEAGGGLVLGRVSSAAAQCCTERGARQAAPEKGGKHRGHLPRAGARGAPGSHIHPLCPCL